MNKKGLDPLDRGQVPKAFDIVANIRRVASIEQRE